MPSSVSASAFQLSTLPPSDPRACPSSLLGRRSTQRLLPPRALPVNSPHLSLLRLLSNCSHDIKFPPTRIHNRNCNRIYSHRENNSRSLSAHGLHILPHLASGHHHFLEVFMRFPRLPPPPVNCSSLEAVYMIVYAMTYI